MPPADCDLLLWPCYLYRQRGVLAWGERLFRTRVPPELRSGMAMLTICLWMNCQRLPPAKPPDKTWGKAYQEIYNEGNVDGRFKFILMQIFWNFQSMQFGTWPFADSNPTISPFFQQPSVLRGLSSFRSFVKETVQTKNPASVITGASFWYYSENLCHCRPPVQFDTVVNGRPTVYMCHHVKE